jgi:3-phosphoshikimate 1-carboxyvinyltransferase
MLHWCIQPGTLSGQLTVPPSKSHFLRAIVLASLAHGESVIHRPLATPDAQAMADACRAFGATIHMKEDVWIIEGVAGRPCFQSAIIDAGNSGLVYRIITALAALSEAWVTIDGDASIRQRRLIVPLLNALKTLGARVEYLESFGQAPFRIRGPITSKPLVLSCIDSQPATALLILGACLPEGLTLDIQDCDEWPWLHVTLDWLSRLNIPYALDKSTISVQSNQGYCAFERRMPGDFSSALYAVLGALLTGSTLEILGLDPADVQGDRQVLDLLQAWGAVCVWRKDILCIQGGQSLRGGMVDLRHYIDALPALVVAASQCQHSVYFKHYAAARFKESDRVQTSVQGLCALGGVAVVDADAIHVKPSSLSGGMTLNVQQDHRLALAWTVAGLISDRPIRLIGTECVTKSYPGFVDDWRQCGALIEVTQGD